MSFISKLAQPIANCLNCLVTYLEIKSLKKDLKAATFDYENYEPLIQLEGISRRDVWINRKTGEEQIEDPYRPDVQMRQQAKRELELIAQSHHSKSIRNLAQKALLS
jgi:hypothetical protein